MMMAVLGCVWRHWLACAIAAATLAVGAFALSLVLEPVYRVELTLSPVNDLPNQTSGALAGIGGLVAAAGLGINPAQAKSESLAMLRSKTFLAEFIKDNNLMPLLYPDVFTADGMPKAGSEADVPTLAEAVTRFSEQILLVNEDARTGLVTLRIDYADPAVGLAWARNLVERVNEVRRERDIAEAAESIQYLERELNKTSQVSVRDAISRVLEEQLQKSTMANVRREYAFKILDPGMLPEKPVRPRPVRMVLAGFLIGALLTAFFFCAREGAFAPVRQ